MAVKQASTLMKPVDETAAHRFSVAPMMELTDRHFRFFARLLSRKALLFTEMVTAKAILHGDRNYLLGFNPEENPLALQLGGSDPSELASAAKIGEQFGYDEINLNIGCPSVRVQSGSFGACLMAEPGLVAECIAAMQDRVDIPVTVKCRIGIDREDRYEPFEQFVTTVAATGCNRFYVHARKAWLDGLSPRENREIPPLRYDYVYRLKESMAQLDICINGGITDWPDVMQHLAKVDGVMLGRAAYQQPELLMQVDKRIYERLQINAQVSKAEMATVTKGSATEADANKHRSATLDAGAGAGANSDTHLNNDPIQTFECKAQAAREYAQYMQKEMARGVPLTAMSRHLIGFFQQQRGARQWRRTLSSIDRSMTDAIGLVEKALAAVEPQVTDGSVAAGVSPVALAVDAPGKVPKVSQSTTKLGAGHAASAAVARN